jgi:hypothetical protein
MTTWRSIPVALLASLLAACVGTPEQEPKLPSMDEMLAQLTEQTGRTCVPFRDIDTHRILEDGLISVSTRRGAHYLATTTHTCRFLGSDSGTLVSDSHGELCSGSGTITDFARSCTVRNIYEFESREAAMAVVEVARARREAAKQFPDQLPQTPD